MEKFLIGAATAAHQVEGNNVNSDFWALEHIEHSDFREPSLLACDHYNRYEEDITLLKEAGLNAYRFSIEWARIEPREGEYDEKEVEHYGRMIDFCNDNGVTPIVTLHHFSSPKWLIAKGGWESETVSEDFADYVEYVISKLGAKLKYVCTINEANMGFQIAANAKDYAKKMGFDVQLGFNFASIAMRSPSYAPSLAAFGLKQGEQVNTFLGMRSEKGDKLIMEAHTKAKARVKSLYPDIKVGLTLSLYDLQARDGGEKFAAEKWQEDFGHYLPYIQGDDFIGVQNYTRKVFDANGAVAIEGAEMTEMGNEFYPESIGSVAKRVNKESGLPVIITENGIATQDDERRREFIVRAMKSVEKAKAEGANILGYCHWTLMDNFEFHKGYTMHFGLIAVNRQTLARTPRESLHLLGSYAKQ